MQLALVARIWIARDEAAAYGGGVAKKTESDEHYVLDLCDAVLAAAGHRQARRALA